MRKLVSLIIVACSIAVTAVLTRQFSRIESASATEGQGETLSISKKESQNDTSNGGYEDEDSFVTENLMGEWEIMKNRGGGISALDQHDVDSLIGTRLSLQDTGFTIFGFRCDSPAYISSIVDLADYLLREYRITPKSIGVNSDSLLVVSVYCIDDSTVAARPMSSSFYTDILYLGQDSLIIPFEGVFFQLKRVR